MYMINFVWSENRERESPQTHTNKQQRLLNYDSYADLTDLGETDVFAAMEFDLLKTFGGER